MSVEGGGISAGGGGLSISGGVGVSAGPTLGAAGGEFGPSVGIGSTIVNEGPVAPAFLENTMPLTLNKFNPIGEIIFNPEPKPAVLTQAEQVAVAAWEYPVASVGKAQGITRLPELSWIPPVPNPARELDVKVITNPFGGAKAEDAPQIIVQKRTESKATNAVERATSTPTQSQVQTEQVVEGEKVVKENKKEDNP